MSIIDDLGELGRAMQQHEGGQTVETDVTGLVNMSNALHEIMQIMQQRAAPATFEMGINNLREAIQDGGVTTFVEDHVWVEDASYGVEKLVTIDLWCAFEPVLRGMYELQTLPEFVKTCETLYERGVCGLYNARMKLTLGAGKQIFLHAFSPSGGRGPGLPLELEFPPDYMLAELLFGPLWHPGDEDFPTADNLILGTLRDFLDTAGIHLDLSVFILAMRKIVHAMKSLRDSPAFLNFCTVPDKGGTVFLAVKDGIDALLGTLRATVEAGALPGVYGFFHVRGEYPSFV